MALQNSMSTTNTSAGRRDANAHLHAAEEYFPHGRVPILDDDLLIEDEYFEPDGVNDFVRDFESWDPDRES